MFIIYNLSGLLLGLAGVFIGILTILLTGRLSFGMIILATVWLAFGFRRRVDATTGTKRPFPSLFFIPLGFFAIPILLLSLPVFFIERVAARQPPQPSDPRAALFNADEAYLRGNAASGDVQLSRAILKTLQSMTVEEAKAEEFRVFSRKKPDAILVLISAPNLKQFKNPAREQLLDLVEGILTAEEGASRKYYIGVKGRVAFGAVRVPPDRTEIGAIVSESVLYPFYGDSAPATRPTTAATNRAPTVSAVERDAATN